MRRLFAVLAVPAAVLGIAAPASAARPAAAPAGSCVVDAGTVTGTGLPTGELINFMVTTGAGTTGWVLGFTEVGTWSVSVPPSSGPTTYEFASRTWGSNGSKYTVFASCA